MPFTASHIAAVLPLRNSRLSFTALVIGSMSPDFSYVVELLGPVVPAHSFAGMFYFCIPFSLLPWFIYTRLLQEHWRKLFPWLTKEKPCPNLWLATLSIAIGAATHIIWDSFTHLSFSPVQTFPIFQEIVLSIGSRDFPLYKVLQHVSTVVGGLAVTLAFHRHQKSHHHPFTTSVRSFVIFAVALSGLTGMLCFKVLVHFLNDDAPSSLEVLLARIAFRSFAALGIVLCVAPFIHRPIKKLPPLLEK